MEHLEKILDQLSNETMRCLKELNKAKDLNERKTQAEIVHLLCQSMGTIIGNTASMMSEVNDSQLIDDEDDEYL